jgi:hypothetical protein
LLDIASHQKLTESMFQDNRSRQSHSDEVHDGDPVAPRTADAEGKPSTFEEAVKKKEWKEAMMEEYQS